MTNEQKEDVNVGPFSMQTQRSTEAERQTEQKSEKLQSFKRDYPRLHELLCPSSSEHDSDYDSFEDFAVAIGRTTVNGSVFHSAVRNAEDTGQGFDEFVLLMRELQLFFTVHKGTVETSFEKLLEHPDQRCQNTPLLLAVYQGKFRFAELLIELGAQTDVRNKYGESYSYLLVQAKKRQNIVFLDTELRQLLADLVRAFQSGQMTPVAFEKAVRTNVLEIAIVVYDPVEKRSVAKLHLLQHLKSFTADQVQADEDSLSDFSRKCFHENSLLDDCRQPPGLKVMESGTGEGEAENQRKEKKEWEVVEGVEAMEQKIVGFLQQHCCPGVKSVGFSVHADLLAIMYAFPEVHRFMNHQIIDLSSFIGVSKTAPNSIFGETVSSKLSKQRVGALFKSSHRAMDDVEASLQVYTQLFE